MPAWRSILFVPADREKFVAAAHTRGADAVQLDLEDSIPAERKAAARLALDHAVDTVTGHGVDVLVRVNRDLRNMVEDLATAIRPGVTAVTIPKVLGADHLTLVDELISELEMARGMTVGETRLIAMIETLDALAAAREIARAAPRLGGITLGSEDFSADGGFEPTPALLHGPCQQIVFAARAAGLEAYGFPGSIAEFSDLDALRAVLADARAMGFGGAFCIHPAQVAPINQAFRPDADSIAQAQRIVRAYEEAVAERRGAVTLDGSMIDLPVVRRARATLARRRPSATKLLEG